MLPNILKYSEIFTDLKCINISTLSLEFHSVVYNRNKNKHQTGKIIKFRIDAT